MNKQDNLNKIIIEAIQDKKGTEICSMDLSLISSAPAFNFIICQGKTPTQTAAIADNIIEKARENVHIRPAQVDGMRNGQWIIIDYGDTMVHVFTPDFREFYNLEDLWSDGKIERIANID